MSIFSRRINLLELSLTVLLGCGLIYLLITTWKFLNPIDDEAVSTEYVIVAPSQPSPLSSFNEPLRKISSNEPVEKEENIKFSESFENLENPKQEEDFSETSMTNPTLDFPQHYEEKIGTPTEPSLDYKLSIMGYTSLDQLNQEIEESIFDAENTMAKFAEHSLVLEDLYRLAMEDPTNHELQLKIKELHIEKNELREHAGNLYSFLADEDITGIVGVWPRAEAEEVIASQLFPGL